MLQRIYQILITGFLGAQAEQEKVREAVQANGRKLDQIIELLTEQPTSTPVATILTITKE